LKGVMTLDWINRRAMIVRMHGMVVDIRKLGKEEEEEEEVGRGSSLFKQGQKWLLTISSGAAELGGGILSKFERKKKDEDARSRPSTGAPQPPGAPPPTLLRAPTEIELRSAGLGCSGLSNPMHNAGTAGVVTKAKDKDTRHLDRATSGGFEK